MANRVLHVDRKLDDFVKFQGPSVIGLGSIDKNREYHNDCRNIKFLHHSVFENNEVKFDLNAGYLNHIPKSEDKLEKEKIDTLLKWLYYDRSKLQNMLKEERFCFLSFRGLLTTIMQTPYENQEDYLICATKWKNLIFLCAFQTDNKKKEILQRSSEQKLFQYWGHKFEQYLLTSLVVTFLYSDFVISHQNKDPDLSAVVNCNEELLAVFRSQLEDDLLFYAGEIDAADNIDFCDANLLNKIKFKELKTLRFMKNNKTYSFERFKTLKWWCQSFIVGIEEIICGYRDDDGIVHKLEQMKTKDLPGKAREWNPCVCMIFLKKFLLFVKNTLKNEPDFSHWLFYWKPGNRDIRPEKIDVELLPQYKILPEWFIDEYSNYFYQNNTNSSSESSKLKAIKRSGFNCSQGIQNNTNNSRSDYKLETAKCSGFNFTALQSSQNNTNSRPDYKLESVKRSGFNSAITQGSPNNIKPRPEYKLKAIKHPKFNSATSKRNKRRKLNCMQPQIKKYLHNISKQP